MSFAVRVWVSFLLLAVGAYGGYSLWRHRAVAGIVSGVGEPTPDTTDVLTLAVRPADAKKFAELSFTERSGEPFRIKQLDGQVWVGSFFFSSCPYTCRQLNVAIAGLQKDLADQDVKFVSFTVDPDNDTPALLAKYAAAFEADPKRWLFLSGPFRDTQQICNELFQLPLSGKNHSERVALIDRQGKLRGAFNALDPLEINSLKKRIAAVLAEPVQSVEPETSKDGS